MKKYIQFLNDEELQKAIAHYYTSSKPGSHNAHELYNSVYDCLIKHGVEDYREVCKGLFAKLVDDSIELETEEKLIPYDSEKSVAWYLLKMDEPEMDNPEIIAIADHEEIVSKIDRMIYGA